MKRIISLVLSLIMIIGCVPMAVFATEPESVSACTVTVDSTHAMPGSEVTINVKITNNPGILGATLTLTYDDDLTLIGCSNGKAFSELTMTKPSQFVSGCNFVWFGSEVKEVVDGAILTLTFKVAEDAVISNFNSISVTCQDVYDTYKNAVDVTTVSGGLHVINYTPGDVTENKKIDPLDLIKLSQYISDNCTTNPNGYNVTINELAADVNDDGKINPLDLIFISQYISDGCKTNPDGYNVTLKPVSPKCQHTSLTAISAKEASCTVDGNIAYWVCECGKYFEDEEALNVIELEDTIIIATGHTEVSVPGYDSTYENEGLTDGVKCSVCSTWIVEQEVIPVKEHEKYSLIYYSNGESNTVSYNKNDLVELTAPEAVEGYDFSGWFTKPKGEGEEVVIIPIGNPDNIQIVYAYWTPHVYKINFTNANGYKSEGIEYTIEDKDIYLNTKPEWRYLIFTGWEDESGKLSYVNGTPVIKTGTTGDIVLDATWKTKQNIFNLPEKQYSNAAFNERDGNYYFFYHLGNVENVLLQPKEGTGRDHGVETTLTTSKTVEVSKSTASEQANSVTNATKVSFENSFESTVTAELSTTIGASATVGAEVDGFFAKGTASATTSTSVTAGASWGATVGSSYSGEDESSQTREFSSTISYMETSSITEETTITLTSEDPQGKYYFLPAGTFEIYSVVLYDPITKELKFDVYSKHIDTYPFTLYIPYSTEVKVNPEMDGVPYEFLEETIKDKILNSLFVFYESGSDDVVIDEENNVLSDNYMIDSNEYLPTCNWYSREGYVFDGWQVYDGNGTILLEKLEDGSAISKLAECADDGNKVFKLKARWLKKHVINLEQTDIENDGTTTVIYTVPGREKTYKDDSCTEETTNISIIPERKGYIFGGYYNGETQCISSNGEILNEIYSVVTDSKLQIKWNPCVYKVSYNANGGDGEMVASEHKYDEAKALIANAFDKEGYTFTSWNAKADGSGIDYSDGEEIINLTSENEAIVELYAQWKANSYTVKHDGNGSTSGSMSDQSREYDDGKALTAYAYSKTGYTFVGWNTKADRSGTSYNNLAVANLTSQNGVIVSLYAQWKANSYTVKFNGNGSTSGSMSDQSRVYDDGVALIANAFDKEGYIFAGWNTEADGSGTAFADSTTANITPDNKATITLYAQWGKRPYTVSFNGNGATSGSMSNQPREYDDGKALTANAYIKAGYSFAGWNTKADGSGTVFADKATANLTTDAGITITLYAQWKANSYTVKHDGNGSTSGSMSTQPRLYDDGKALTANAFKRAYTVTYNYNGSGASNGSATATYKFNGWATSSSGSVAYTDKSTANIATSGTVTLYAKWTSASVTLPTPTRTGYTFGGWYKEAACTNKVGNGGAAYTPTATITLYAKWTPITYTVKYNANGGSGSTASSTHTYDSSKSLTSNGFSRSNYTFLGWSTNSSATTPTYTNGQSVKNLTSTNGGTVNLYAVWVKTSGSYGYYSRDDEIWSSSTPKEIFYLGFNKSALKSAGYKTISITMTVHAWENWIGMGVTPYFYIYNASGSQVKKWTWSGELACSDVGGDWKTQTFTVSINVDDLQSDGSVKVGYSSKAQINIFGVDTSCWHRGTVEMTVTAKK